MFRDGLRENGGPTDLRVGAVADGELVKRSGATLVGDATVVRGPSSATDNTLPRFDGATGKLLQGSGVTVDDSNHVFTPGNITASGNVIATNTPIVNRGYRLQPYVNISNGPDKLLTSNTAYWCWLGTTLRPISIFNVITQVTTAGAGAQTAEYAIASSPTPPYFGNLTLTKIAATNDLVSLTSTGAKGLNNNVDWDVAAGVNLWVGMRTAMATTQPTIVGCNFDFGQGEMMLTNSAGALTGAGPWTSIAFGASVPSDSAACPLIVAFFVTT